jgi:hypothetical protein
MGTPGPSARLLSVNSTRVGTRCSVCFRGPSPGRRSPFPAPRDGPGNSVPQNHIEGQRPDRSVPVMRTVGPLARWADVNSRGLVAMTRHPGPPLRCSPGYGNAWAVGPFARRELDAGRRALVGVFSWTVTRSPFTVPRPKRWPGFDVSTKKHRGPTARPFGPVMRTVGPLARSAHVNSRGLVGVTRHPGPPLRCSPGYGNAWAVGPLARRELEGDRHALVGVFSWTGTRSPFTVHRPKRPNGPSVPIARAGAKRWPGSGPGSTFPQNHIEGQRPDRSVPVMRTVGPLARSAHMNSRGLVAMTRHPGPPLRCSPGYGNAWAVGPFARRELDAGGRALVGVFSWTVNRSPFTVPRPMRWPG